VELVAFVVPFVLLGVGVLFVAFSGGPGRAREVYLTRGGRGFRIAIAAIYIVCGIGIPALILANREEAEGGVGPLQSADLSTNTEEGKKIFRSQCASCHNLDAVNARGVAGPDLDEIGAVTARRILNAIKNGGTGQGRMPKALLEGEEARDVADYVADVAGKGQGG
jgi:cytochrome c553